VQRLLPQMSSHPGMTQMVRGQNVLFVDGRVAFLATGPTLGGSRLWLFDEEPGLELRAAPGVVLEPVPPVLPAVRWGQ